MQQSFELLELRIAQMIERIKELQSERIALQARADEQERIIQKQSEERRMVRHRIEKVLERLQSVTEEKR